MQLLILRARFNCLIADYVITGSLWKHDSTHFKRAGSRVDI